MCEPQRRYEGLKCPFFIRQHTTYVGRRGGWGASSSMEQCGVLMLKLVLIFVSHHVWEHGMCVLQFAPILSTHWHQAHPVSVLIVRPRVSTPVLSIVALCMKVSPKDNHRNIPLFYDGRGQVLFIFVARSGASTVLRKTESKKQRCNKWETVEIYELGQLKNGWKFLRLSLMSHLKIELENWKYWPWYNSVHAGPAILRIWVDLGEISKKIQMYLSLA